MRFRNHALSIGTTLAWALTCIHAQVPQNYRLDFSSYFGGSDIEHARDIAADANGNVYIVGGTESPDFPVSTASPFAKANSGTNVGLVKLSPTGALLLATVYGGSQGEGPDGIYVEDDGDIVIGGETASPDLPLVPGAFDSALGGVRDGFFLNLSADFTRLNYATYFGGASEDNVRGLFAGIDGKVYLTGSSNGPGFPVRNAVQPAYGGGSGGCCAIGDAFVARFSPAGPATGDLARRRVRGGPEAARELPRRLWYRPGHPAAFAEAGTRYYDPRGKRLAPPSPKGAGRR